MGINFGVFAGTLAEYFDKENDRVTATTDKVLDSLANIVIRENDARQKKVDTAKESISRLEALGFTRAKAASIARGGLYAVNDAATAANTARDMGEDVNSYYSATAEFSPDDYKDYTVAELAQSITPQVNIDAAADALVKGRQINPNKVNAAVGKYKGSTTSTDIDLPAFAQDVSKIGSGKIDFALQQKAGLNWRRTITARAEGLAVEKTGLNIGTDVSGNKTYAINNADTYAAWIKTQIPDILEEQKEMLPAKEYDAYERYVGLITKRFSGDSDSSTLGLDGNRFNDTGKAVLKGEKPRDSNKVKNAMLQGLGEGETYETLKAEAIEDGISEQLFEQIYTELTGQSLYHRSKYGPKPYTLPETQ